MTVQELIDMDNSTTPTAFGEAATFPVSRNHGVPRNPSEPKTIAAQVEKASTARFGTICIYIYPEVETVDGAATLPQRDALGA